MATVDITVGVATVDITVGVATVDLTRRRRHANRITTTVLAFSCDAAELSQLGTHMSEAATFSAKSRELLANPVIEQFAHQKQRR
jgi:hypothetical protein